MIIKARRVHQNSKNISKVCQNILESWGGFPWRSDNTDMTWNIKYYVEILKILIFPSRWCFSAVAQLKEHIPFSDKIIKVFLMNNSLWVFYGVCGTFLYFAWGFLVAFFGSAGSFSYFLFVICWGVRHSQWIVMFNYDSRGCSP